MNVQEIWKKYHMVIIAGVVVVGGIYLYRQYNASVTVAPVTAAPVTPVATPVATTSFTGQTNFTGMES